MFQAIRLSGAYIVLSRHAAGFSRRKPPAHSYPFLFQPEHEAGDGPPQDRYILCNEQQADRQELDSDHGKKPEEARNDAENAQRQTNPP
jgi:hypothetical protein